MAIGTGLDNRLRTSAVLDSSEEDPAPERIHVSESTIKKRRPLQACQRTMFEAHHR